jgi:hypothetical protein
MFEVKASSMSPRRLLGKFCFSLALGRCDFLLLETLSHTAKKSCSRPLFWSVDGRVYPYP